MVPVYWGAIQTRLKFARLLPIIVRRHSGLECENAKMLFLRLRQGHPEEEEERKKKSLV